MRPVVLNSSLQLKKKKNEFKYFSISFVSFINLMKQDNCWEIIAAFKAYTPYTPGFPYDGSLEKGIS